MQNATKPTPTRSSRVLLFALSLVLAAAGAGVAVFGAQAATGAGLALEASANASAGANVNAGDPLMEAASGAKEVAQSAGLKAAVGGAWRVAWEKSWPFIKSMVLKFFGLFGQAWRAIFQAATSTNVNAGANVNVGANVNASVNASGSGQ